MYVCNVLHVIQISSPPKERKLSHPSQTSLLEKEESPICRLLFLGFLTRGSTEQGTGFFLPMVHFLKISLHTLLHLFNENPYPLLSDGNIYKDF